MSSIRKEVSFYSDYLKLSAYLYLPGDYREGEKRPGIVCIHGYSGMKHVYLLPVPERLAEKGYVALAIDHRGFGKSEGIKARNQPMEQVRDIRHAMTFMQQQPQVDPERIGLYGTSFGGATVTYTAAVDQRAKCVVSTVGIGNGRRWLKSLRRHWEWLELLRRIEEDHIHRVMTGEAKRVDLAELIPSDLYSQQVIQDYLKPAEAYPGDFPLENAEGTIEFSPEDVADKISPRAICFIHGTNDALVPVDESISMYEKAREPKKLFLIPGGRHYDMYKFYNPEIYEVVMKETLEWFQQHL